VAVSLTEGTRFLVMVQEVATMGKFRLVRRCTFVGYAAYVDLVFVVFCLPCPTHNALVQGRCC